MTKPLLFQDGLQVLKGQSGTQFELIKTNTQMLDTNATQHRRME